MPRTKQTNGTVEQNALALATENTQLAHRAFIKMPSAKNLNALVKAAQRYQQVWMSEFQGDE